jgi:hypothetical protein
MTRRTATMRNSKARLVLEVDLHRDETSGYRHQWTTTARLGLLSAQGPNTRDAIAGLADKLAALAHSAGAEAALIAEGAAAHAHYVAELPTFGQAIAVERMRRCCAA